MKEKLASLPYWGNSMEDHLGIRFLPPDEEGNPRAQMPVDHRTCQPYGIVNGGASLTLAETLTGHASAELCAEDEMACGIQVSGNHISSAKVGETLTATARLLHKGSGTHIWDVNIRTDNGKLVSSVRVLNYIKKHHESAR